MVKQRIIPLTDIRHESGNCWIARLPDEVAQGETEDSSSASPLVLFEDSESLGPTSAPHAVIREQGRGAYSHWNRELFFSTSDNSNPLQNRRRYVIAAPLPTADRKEVSHAESGPVNYSITSADPQKISEDSDYAIRIARSYIDALPGGPEYLRGKSVLELGPGTNFATGLALKALGADAVFMADRFLAPFKREYHEPLYKDFGEKLSRIYTSVDKAVFTSYCRDEYSSPLIKAVESPLETIQGLFRDIDITLSNAVFEHLYNPLEAIQNLYSVMSSGGIGLHQVDFRYHREFDRPLEYLLMDEISYARLFDSCHGECGNRTRPIQMTEMFKFAGFSEVECQGNMFADPAYLDDFMGRLDRQTWSPYRHYSAEQLSVVSARFAIRK